MREYRFELRLCAMLETRLDGIIARQVGAGVARPGNRILDVVVVDTGPGFARRAAITPRAIPPEAIQSEVGPGRARRWPPNGDWHPEAARRVLEAAVSAGFFEHERRGGTDYVRQTVRYPDWFGPITGIENKPDLGDPGALAAQLRHDVSLGLVDQIILATASHVTGAHLNRLPDAVGVWQFRPDASGAERLRTVREPTPLASDDWGIEVLDASSDRVDVRPISPVAKRHARVRLAELAYGKGWRTFTVPACAHARPEPDAGATLPGCSWYDAIIDPRECGPSCPGYRPGDPPEIDIAAERDERTPWIATSPGRTTRQAGLDAYRRQRG